METQVQLFKGLPFSLSEQTDFANNAIQEILDGNVNPLHAELHLRAIQETIKKITEHPGVKSAVMEEAEKYDKTFDFHGAKITRSSRITKDYSQCNDQVLSGLYSDLEDLKAKIKAREMMVATGSDPATGEIFNQPITKTTQFLSVKW